MLCRKLTSRAEGEVRPAETVGTGKTGLKMWSASERNEAAELSSSELQHWVLRPSWSRARTTQQQTEYRLPQPPSVVL